MNPAIYLSATPQLLPIGQRAAALLRRAGLEPSLCMVERLPEGHGGPALALGDFPGVAAWVAAGAGRSHCVPWDWDGSRAWVLSLAGGPVSGITVFADRCEGGAEVLPGEFWLAGEHPDGLRLAFAPPEWALHRRLLAMGLRLSLAESCTGGGLSARLTALPGSSAWFMRGLVTYSNAAKEDLLGVRGETLAQVGAVAEETALEMLAGALRQGDMGAAITGIAGPGGATQTKPVGTVCIAWGRRGAAPDVGTFHFRGGRWAVQHAAGSVALGHLLALCDE